MKMQRNKFKFTVTLLVTDNWVEDGFDLDSDKIRNHIKNLLPWAFDNEILIKIDKIEKSKISIGSVKQKKSVGYA